MIRTTLVLVIAVAVIVAATVVSVWGDPGSVTVVWGDWRLDATAAWLSAVLALVALALAVVWEATGSLAALPRRMKATRAGRRREQATQAAMAGFAALGADDPQRARDHAAAASRLDPDLPLVVLLRAQTADATGDATAAEADWSKLADAAETRAAADAALARIADRRARVASAAGEAPPPLSDDPRAPEQPRALGAPPQDR